MFDVTADAYRYAVCEHGCCHITYPKVSRNVHVYPPPNPRRICMWCDEPREERGCGEPCSKCGGIAEL